jgi:hypothetical protein
MIDLVICAERANQASGGRRIDAFEQLQKDSLSQAEGQKDVKGKALG